MTFRKSITELNLHRNGTKLKFNVSNSLNVVNQPVLCARVKKLFKGDCIFLGNSNPFWPGDNWSFIDLYWCTVRREQCSKVCYAGIFDYLTLLSRRFYFWKTFLAISCPRIGLIWWCSPETFRNVPFTDTCVHSQKILCFVWQLKTHYAVWSEKKTFHIF